MTQIQGALTTGAVTYAVERWYQQEDDPMKLAALGAACHIGANVASARLTVGTGTSTAIAAAAYSFLAPRVAQVNDPEAFLGRFLIAVGSNYAGNAIGGRVGNFIGGRNYPGSGMPAHSILPGDAML